MNDKARKPIKTRGDCRLRSPIFNALCRDNKPRDLHHGLCLITNRRLYSLASNRDEVHRVKTVFFLSQYGISWMTYHVDSSQPIPGFNSTDSKELIQKQRTLSLSRGQEGLFSWHFQYTSYNVAVIPSWDNGPAGIGYWYDTT